MSDRQGSKKEIVVLGAGVIGLTTAILIQESGAYRVTVIADTLPGDVRSSGYTSHWAGAHHVTLSGADPQLQKIDKETFEVMWKLSEPNIGSAEGCFMRLKQQEFYEDGYESGTVLDYYPNRCDLLGDDLPPGAIRGVEFETVTVDVPVYLHYLQARLLARGGAMSRGTVQHIDQIFEGGPYIFHHDSRKRSELVRKVQVDALVVCVGLGARSLGGVEDKDVYPTRGQTVILRAPWVKTGRTLTGRDWAYVIPRRNGDVVVGGIREADDWYPLPRSETRLDILKRCLALSPEIAPPDVARTRTPTVDDLIPLIVEDGCGLRPSRKGGPRLDSERVQTKDGRSIPVLYNYGHGGHGYISSWGSASVTLARLIEELGR